MTFRLFMRQHKPNFSGTYTHTHIYIYIYIYMGETLLNLDYFKNLNFPKRVFQNMQKFINK